MFWVFAVGRDVRKYITNGAIQYSKKQNFQKQDALKY